MFLFLLVNNTKNDITIVSNIANIDSGLLSVNNIFTISLMSKFKILSKSLFNKKCKFTDAYEHIPMLNIIAIINNTFLFILFLPYWNSTFLLF